MVVCDPRGEPNRVLADPDAQQRQDPGEWPLYSLMAISAGLFVTLLYRYHAYPDERGPTFYRIETAMLTARRVHAYATIS